MGTAATEKIGFAYQFQLASNELTGKVQIFSGHSDDFIDEPH
jgi:hypothetical protein